MVGRAGRADFAASNEPTDRDSRTACAAGFHDGSIADHADGFDGPNISVLPMACEDRWPERHAPGGGIMCRWTASLLTLLMMPLAAGVARAAEGAPAPLPPGGAVATLPGHGELGTPGVAPGYMPPVQPGYPYLNAPLYPSPQPNVPVQVGSTLITNQAFAPQEMLYPHDYEAMYPPYYYRAKGWWVATPFGPRRQENWELLGTKVKVKYRSAIPFWTGFHAPHRKYFDYDENWSNPSATKYSGRHFN